MKRNFFSLFIAVSFLVVGHLQSAPTPTPTPKPGLKIKSMVVTTPTPAPPPKRIKGAVAGPTSTPIKIDKRTKTGPGPTQAPIKVIKTQVSTPTPTPSRKIKDQVTSTTTPIKIPKDGVTGGGGRPGPINLGGPTPGPKRLIPGSNNLPPGPGGKSIILQSKDPNVTARELSDEATYDSVPPPPPPPNTGTGNQNQNPVVNADTPVGGNTGTVAKSFVEMTNLAVYMKNGFATMSTGSSEFPSQLSTIAKVNGDFKFQWTRDKASAEEKKGVLVVFESASQKPIGSAPLVAIPAGSTTTDVDFKFPENAAPGEYNGIVVAAMKTISNRVRLIYPGSSGNADITLPQTGGSVPPAPAQKSYSIKLTRFVPGSGDSPPQLFYKIETAAATTVSDIVLEVYSKPFTNSQNLTAGSGEKGPIKLFSGKSGTINVSANSTKEHSAHLKKASDNGSLEDWNIANGKTDNATFRWSGPGQTGGEAERPLHTAWP
jgi:hypothetical protein